MKITDLRCETYLDLYLRFRSAAERKKQKDEPLVLAIQNKILGNVSEQIIFEVALDAGYDPERFGDKKKKDKHANRDAQNTLMDMMVSRKRKAEIEAADSNEAGAEDAAVGQTQHRWQFTLSQSGTMPLALPPIPQHMPFPSLLQKPTGETEPEAIPSQAAPFQPTPPEPAQVHQALPTQLDPESVSEDPRPPVTRKLRRPVYRAAPRRTSARSQDPSPSEPTPTPPQGTEPYQGRLAAPTPPPLFTPPAARRSYGVSPTRQDLNT